MALESRLDGRLVLVTGSSRSGKTAWVAQQVDRYGPLLVWDSVGEWSDRYGCKRIGSVRGLADAVTGPAGAGRLALDVPVTAGNFEAFARLAMIAAKLRDGLRIVVEELADVTTPGKAPAAWGELCRKGLRYGPEIFAITQRPAESDKTAAGNASLIHAHRMALARDRAYMAALLDVPVSRVEKLAPLEYLERTADGRKSAGRVTFGRAKVSHGAKVKRARTGT